MNHQHSLQHPNVSTPHTQMLTPQQQQQQQLWIRQQQLVRQQQQQQQQQQQVLPQQSVGSNGAQGQQQQFLAYPQGNQMGANQMGAGNPQMSLQPGSMNPGMGNQMGSGNASTLQNQLQSQMSPMGQMGTPGVNQLGSQISNAALQSQLQQQRFGGRPGSSSSPMGPPTPVSGPSASPRALPTPSPRPLHPPTPSHSPHPVAGSGTPQLDLIGHSPQLQPDDSGLTPQEQLSKYVEQL